MPAEWDLRAYRVDHAKLAAFAGSDDNALRKKIIAATDDDLAEDYRLDPPGLDDALAEIASGKLHANHATAYRIATEAILEALAERVTFNVPPPHGDKGWTQVTTYADRDRVPRALKAVGLTTLAKVWADPWQPLFPWVKPRDAKKNLACDWPWATFVDEATLDKATAEITKLIFSTHDIGFTNPRLIWRHATKYRMVIDEGDGDYALFMQDGARSEYLARGQPLDEILAMVPDADFPGATNAAAPKAPKLTLCPMLTKESAGFISRRLKKVLKLNEYTEDVVDVVLGLIAIVGACDAASSLPDAPSPKKKKAAAASKKKKKDTKGTRPFSSPKKRSVMLYVDGEQ